MKGLEKTVAAIVARHIEAMLVDIVKVVDGEQAPVEAPAVEVEALSAEEVRKLATKAIKKGVKRQDLAQLVQDAGAKTIVELNAEQLVVLRDSIEAAIAEVK